MVFSDFPSIDRLVGGSRRRLFKLPFINSIHIAVRRRAVERHRSQMAPPLPYMIEVLQKLNSHGLVIAGQDQAANFGFDLRDDTGIFSDLLEIGSVSTSRMKASDFATLSPLYLVGLHPSLVELAERYIGLPIFYLGFEAKVEFPDGRPGGARNWHVDLEDVRVLKILVYLTDVGEDDGPLQYIPDGEKIAANSASRIGIHCDSDIEAVNKVSCTGPARTMVLFDGARLVHRTKPPTGKTPRLSVMYSYSSRWPRQIFAGARPSTEAKRELRSFLPASLLACVP